MVATVKFSQFSAGSLANSTNKMVGVSADSSGMNIQVPFPFVWTTATRPVTPTAGTEGYNSSLGQIEYWNGASWVQLAAGGSGSVNLGGANQLAYYENTGTAVSALLTANNAVLLTDVSGIPAWSSATANYFLIADASGVPGWSNTLPSGLTFNDPVIDQPNIVGITDGSNAAAGSVGEEISSFIPVGSAVATTTLADTNLTSISLTAGDWDVWGNITFTFSNSSGTSIFGWLSEISATAPDISLYSSMNTSFSNMSSNGICVPQRRFNLSSTTTIYITGQASFASGSCMLCGGIYARRRR